MATDGSSVHIGIQEEDHHFFRVIKAYMSVVMLTLLQVLKWGCTKTDLDTYEKYLIDSGMSRTDYKKAFDSQQRKKILNNPSADKFDISLIYKMIQRACHSLAPFWDDAWTTESTKSDPTRLEYWLTCIKNARNKLMHDLPVFTRDTMKDQIENLRETLKNVIQKSGTLYNVNIGTVDNIMRRINDNLNNIRDQPFADDFSILKDFLRDYGAQELKQKYDAKTFFDPLYFLDKKECFLKVASVFVCPTIEDNKDRRSTTSCRSVHFKDLLKYLNTTTTDYLMMLEGQPGVGKTTLLRLYRSEWIAGGGDIKGLYQYDLVLHLECRDTSIDSFTKLLCFHMPKTTSKIQKNDLMHILLSLKVMVLVDGIDELNEASQKVFKEILNIKSSHDFTLICTTRPERIPEVKKLVSPRMKVIHMIIQGIPKQERGEFVRAYHNELKQHDVIKGLDINGLLEYLRKVPPHLQDFLRFPLNLVMLTFLWDDPNSRIRDITSTTALYLETHNLLVEKLHERLMNQPSTQHMSLTDLRTKCETFLAYMYMEALRAQANDVVFLNKGQIKDLNELCKSLNLPAEEIFSAFLVSASNDRSLTHSKMVKFPHKTLQDFYAANFLAFLLEENLVSGNSMYKRKCDELDDYSKQQIVKHIQESLGQPFSICSVLLKFDKDQAKTQHFEKYRNIIFQLVYLLHKSDPKTLAHYAEEIVTLLGAGEHSVFQHMEFQHWADLLKESQYNATLAQKISKVLLTSFWHVKDQHVKAAVVFLSYICPSGLHITIRNDPKDVPDLHDLMETVLATHYCKITIKFHHHWEYPESGLSNSLLQKLVPSRDCIR